MAYDIYILSKGSVYSRVSQVTAESTEDVVNFDNTNYRNLLGADVVGRPWQLSYTFPVVSPVQPEFKDDRLTPTVPYNESKKRTRYKWTTATGLFWEWADQVIGVYTNPPGFAGSILPALTATP